MELQEREQQELCYAGYLNEDHNLYYRERRRGQGADTCAHFLKMEVWRYFSQEKIKKIIEEEKKVQLPFPSL